VIDSLHQNTKSDIKTLKGRQSISIIAPFDCEEVVQPALPASPMRYATVSLTEEMEDNATDASSDVVTQSNK
jgi:hypothetical protein